MTYYVSYSIFDDWGAHEGAADVPIRFDTVLPRRYHRKNMKNPIGSPLSRPKDAFAVMENKVGEGAFTIVLLAGKACAGITI